MPMRKNHIIKSFTHKSKDNKKMTEVVKRAGIDPAMIGDVIRDLP